MTTEPVRYREDDHEQERTLLVAAVYVLLRREGQVLLHLRAGTGYRDGHWALIAGHVDAGESVHEAAVREAFEEAGVTIDPVDLVPVTALHRFERDGAPVEQRLDVFFEATRWSGHPTLQEPDRAAEMGWFELADLPDPVVPHERMVLDLLALGEPVPAVMSLPMAPQ